MSGKSKFQQNELVLAIDRAQLFEAKILKIQEIDGNCKYFIHFNGWSKKYDVWVEENHLAHKNNTKEISKLKEFAEEYYKIGSKNVTQAQEEFISALHGTTKGSTGKGGRGRKRKADGSDEELENEDDDEKDNEKERRNEELEQFAKSVQRFGKKKPSDVNQQREILKKRKQLLEKDLRDDEDDFCGGISKKLNIPQNLKVMLVEDWKSITKTPQKLISLPLPKDVTVSAAIDSFLEKHKASSEYDEYQMLLSGLKIQFDKVCIHLISLVFYCDCFFTS
jgi:hypothetical protein